MSEPVLIAIQDDTYPVRPENYLCPEFAQGDVDFWGLILTQDYANRGEVRKGMRSRAFGKARPNPKQEIGLTNFHRNLRRIIKRGYAL